MNKKFISIFLLFFVFSIYYLIVLFYVKSDFFFNDEYRFYALEFVKNYYNDGVIAFLKAKENESFPLIQRVLTLSIYKFSGQIHIKYFYISTLFFLIGTGITLYKVIKINRISALFLIVILLNLFTFKNTFLLWLTANYFIPTFAITFFFFYILIYKPEKVKLQYLLLLLVPYGAVKGLLTIAIAFVYYILNKKWKESLVTSAIMLFQIFIFFFATYQANRGSFSENILYCLKHPIDFLVVFFALFGQSLRIIDSLVVPLTAVGGILLFLFIVFAIVYIYKIKKDQKIALWAFLVLTFVSLSLITLVIQRLPTKPAIEVVNTSWYWIFSYFTLTICAILLGYLIRDKKINALFFITPFILLHFLQLRSGIPLVLQMRSISDANQFNFERGFKVAEDDADSTSSTSINYLISKNKFYLKPSSLDKLNHYTSESIIVDSVFVTKEIIEFNGEKQTGITFSNLDNACFKSVYLLLQKEKQYAIQPVLGTKSIVDFLKKPLQSFKLSNRYQFIVSEEDLKHELVLITKDSPKKVLFE